MAFIWHYLVKQPPRHGGSGPRMRGLKANYSIAIIGTNFGSVPLDSPRRRVSIAGRRVLVVTNEIEGFWYWSPAAADGSGAAVYVSLDVPGQQHRYIVAQTPKGVGANLTLEVTVDTSTTESLFSYDRPRVYGVFESTAPGMGAGYGSLSTAVREALALRRSALSLLDQVVEAGDSGSPGEDSYNATEGDPRALWLEQQGAWGSYLAEVDAEDVVPSSDRRAYDALILPGITHAIEWLPPAYEARPEYTVCTASNSSVCFFFPGLRVEVHWGRFPGGR